MNLPNKLSIARIALIPVFAVLFFLPFTGAAFVALGVFIIASLTDWLDGYIARKYNMCTDVGNFLDTIADKMLVAVVLICVTVGQSFIEYYQPLDRIFLPHVIELGRVIMFIILACTAIMICRELMISGLKMIAQTKNVTIKADKLGKYKMVIQIVALVVLIPFSDIHSLHYNTGAVFLYIGTALLLIATIISIISMVNYLIKYKAVFREKQEDGDGN